MQHFYAQVFVEACETQSAYFNCMSAVYVIGVCVGSNRRRDGNMGEVTSMLLQSEVTRTRAILYLYDKHIYCRWIGG